MYILAKTLDKTRICSPLQTLTTTQVNTELAAEFPLYIYKWAFVSELSSALKVIFNSYLSEIY